MTDRKLLKFLLRKDTCFNCFFFGGHFNDGPWWCSGGQHVGYERKEAPRNFTCNQFRQLND